MSPASGPLAGGAAVTLTGTDLSTATAVRFGTHTVVPTVVNDREMGTTTARRRHSRRRRRQRHHSGRRQQELVLHLRRRAHCHRSLAHLRGPFRWHGLHADRDEPDQGERHVQRCAGHQHRGQRRGDFADRHRTAPAGTGTVQVTTPGGNATVPGGFTYTLQRAYVTNSGSGSVSVINTWPQPLTDLTASPALKGRSRHGRLLAGRTGGCGLGR
ncbi:hypothetical protein CP981_06550 [Streptomyces platensis]|uniref:IPT/TIG domain-containing protein n=1 Tax=Streptomyces platensis TaxID=58346 RepID=A0AAE6NGC6_STRPT|nr:hypothetical protein CP981_06550 [Streptomyces platensis]